LLTLDLCARLSTGRPFPDGSPGPGPLNSLVLNGEDGAEDTIRPRLQAASADLERVFVLQRPANDAPPPLLLPARVDVLDEALRQTEAKLVVIDPIMAFLEPHVALGSDAAVRQALFPLAQLAELHHCVILLVRHLNKGGSRQSIYRGGGSIGIVGVCRSAWLVAPDPQEPKGCVLAQVKTNLAPPQPSLAYAVQAPEAASATVTWLGPSPWTADQLLATAANASAAVTARELARDFLTKTLANGPRTSREVWTLAQEKGLTRRTLRRAKLDLKVRSERVWAEGQRLS